MGRAGKFYPAITEDRKYPVEIRRRLQDESKVQEAKLEKEMFPWKLKGFLGFVCLCISLACTGQTPNISQSQTQPAQPRTIVLDSHSQVSLGDAYRNVCASGGMLVMTPDYKSDEAIPAPCENQPAVLDLRRPDSLTGRLNVRNQGAAGDSKSDDTAALQKAIQYALDHPVGPGPKGSPVVYLPSGTYKISKTLRIPAQMHFIGDGPETTTLQLANPTANLITVAQGKCGDWSCNGSLEGVTLQGDGHLTTGTLLEIIAADGFHLRDVKMYNHGGRGLQLNYGAERFDSNNLYIYAVRWPIILAGDINESYFWNTQIIAPGGTNEATSNGDKYCYSVNCVNGKFPAPNSGPGGSPTPVAPDTHAAIFVDKAVNFSFYGGSIKPLKYAAGLQVFNGNVGAVKNFYFEGFPWDQAGRLNAAVIAGGAAAHTTLTAALSGNAKVVPVASTDWMPHLFTDPNDIASRDAGYFPYVLLPQDYASGSTEPSQFVPGVKRGQYEIVNIAGFAADGKLYIMSRGGGGTAPGTTSWPAGSIVEEMPYGFYGALSLGDSHINAIWPAGKGYRDTCDQTGVRTCADIIVGNIPDGLYVDPNGGSNATPSHRPYAGAIDIASVTIAGGDFVHKGEIATHRFARIAFEGGATVPTSAQGGEVVNEKNLRLDIWAVTGGKYLTAPLYATGRTAEPHVTFGAIGGVYAPASGLFARYESQSGQEGYPSGGWMNGLKYANQYCWFDTPQEGQKQSANRICMNGGPANTAHPGFEYDVWSGSKWVKAFQVQGKPDATADISISGNLSVAKTLYVKAIEVAGAGAGSFNSAKSTSSPSPTGMAGVTTAIGGTLLQPGQCSSGSARLSGATSSMVATASPVSDPGDGFIWQAFVSAANTVIVKVCAIGRGMPKAVAYNVRVQ